MATTAPAPIDGLTTIVKTAVSLSIADLSLQAVVTMPDGGKAGVYVSLTAGSTTKAGSIDDVMTTLRTAIADDASNLSETMPIEGGYVLQVALTRC